MTTKVIGARTHAVIVALLIGGACPALAQEPGLAPDEDVREDVDRIAGETDVLRREVRLVRDRIEALDRRLREALAERATAPAPAPAAEPERGELLRRLEALERALQVRPAPTASAAPVTSVARVDREGFTVPGLPSAGMATPEEVARAMFQALQAATKQSAADVFACVSAFDRSGNLRIPPALWERGRPRDAATSPLVEEALVVLEALRGIAADSALSNLVVEGGAAVSATKRVRFSFSPKSASACEVTLLLARLNERWVVVSLGSPWFEARIRELFDVVAAFRGASPQLGSLSERLKSAFPELERSPVEVRIGLYRLDDRPDGGVLATPLLRTLPELALVKKPGGGPWFDVKVILRAATPETPPLDAPAWFQALPAAKRPPLPLPQGVRFGDAPGEYVNEREGSILIYLCTALAPGESLDDSERWFIGKSEVSWGQYRAFCKATGRAEPRRPTFLHDGRHPVVNVSREDAQAYCTWAGLRLPSAHEWRYTARGPEGRVYAWGDDYGNDQAVWEQHTRWGGKGTAPCGSTQDRTPEGVLDLAGNVAEWAGDEAHMAYGTPHAAVMGGFWRASYTRCGGDAAAAEDLATGFNHIGFRIALDAR